LVWSRFERVFGLFFSSRRRHTSFSRDWSSDVCSSDLGAALAARLGAAGSTGAPPAPLPGAAVLQLGGDALQPRAGGARGQHALELLAHGDEELLAHREQDTCHGGATRRDECHYHEALGSALQLAL